MSVYSSTEQINLLKNIFTPEFQFGQGGFFQPTVKTYLPGNVEIGDPTTNYSLTLNGNALASDLTVANWSINPAVSTLSMASSSITDVSSIQLVGGNTLTRTQGTINNLSGLQSINGFALTISSAVILGSSTIYIGSGAGGIVSVSDAVAIGLRSGNANTKSGLVAIGRDSALNNTGDSTVAIGLSAGCNNVGNSNIFVGPNAGNGMTNANGNNIAIGVGSAINTNGIRSVMIGVGAGTASSLANDTIAIGTNAGVGCYGSSIVGVGFQAGYNSSGSDVIAIGYNAGAGNLGTNCIFLGSNALGSTANTRNNTFFVYSTKGKDFPFLQGDMSANILGIGKAPVSGFGLAVQGSIQNTLSVSATSGNITLTSNNASTRFFVASAVTLTLPSLGVPGTAFASGTHWVVTNTSSSPVIATIAGGPTVNNVSSITLPAVTLGVGRQVTIAYPGSGLNFYAF